MDKMSLFTLFLMPFSLFALDIPVTLYESTSQYDISDEPVTFVVPLPKEGNYVNPESFRFEDGSGNEVPAQFNTLNRWLSHKDKTIQHLLVTTRVSLSSGAKGSYRVKDIAHSSVSNGIVVSENSTSINVNTGPLQFTVKKSGFNIFDQVSINGKAIIESSIQNGGVLTYLNNTGKQYTAENTQVTAEIEESGPIRSVIKLFGRTRYVNKQDFNFGFICRMYAYAGKPYVRVDFSLRNTPHAGEDQPAGPFYFEDFSLVHRLKIGSSPTVKAGGTSGTISDTIIKATEDTTKKQWGYVDVFDGSVGVTTYIRHFWEMYPKENAYLPSSKSLKIGLWPDGHQDWRYVDFPNTTYKGPNNEPKGTKVYTNTYWLDDGMQKTFQIFYLFHDSAISNDDLEKRAALIRKHPLGRANRASWNNAKTLAEGGFIAPEDNLYPGKSLPGSQTTGYYWTYGYLDYYGQVGRKQTGGVGGIPDCAHWFLASGNTKAYFDWEPFYLMETDVRYTHMDDFMKSMADTSLKISPYFFYGYWYKNGGDGGWWKTHADCKYDSTIGNGPHGYGANDPSHAWPYANYDLFLAGGDRRIQDYFAEQGAFLGYYVGVTAPRRSIEWNERPPSYTGDRTGGHSLAAASLGYTVTGDTNLHWLAKRYVDSTFAWFDKKVGTYGHNGFTPGFLTGFFGRALLYFINTCDPSEEIQKQKALSLVSAYTDAAIGWGWYPGSGPVYNIAFPGDTNTNGRYASVTSVPAGDVVAWMYLTTGAPRYRDSMMVWQNYQNGIYFRNWKGGYTGRTTDYMEKIGLADTTLPAQISDLTLSGNSKLTFSSPGGKSFMVRWYTKNIRDTYFKDMNLDTSTEISWWAANIAPSWDKPLQAGSSQTIDLYDVPAGTQVMVMVKTIGDNGLWSKGSNIATATITQTISSENKWIEVSDEKEIVKAVASLSVSPNPFNPVCKISVSIPDNSNYSTLAIYNASGKVIRTWKMQPYLKSQTIVWNAAETKSSTGIYIVKLTSTSKSFTRKIVLVK